MKNDSREINVICQKKAIFNALLNQKQIGTMLYNFEIKALFSGCQEKGYKVIERFL